MNSLPNVPSLILSLLFLSPFVVVSFTQAFAASKNDLVRDRGANSIPHQRRPSRTKLYGTIPTTRRKFHSTFLGGLLGGEILSSCTINAEDARAATVVATKKTTKAALIDVPMVRLQLPRGGFGREYIALKMKIKGQGPFDFMVDSGLTTELITPHLREILGVQEGRNRLTALAAGGETASNPIVELVGASIIDNTGGDSSFSLDLPKLTAVITDFPQEHIDPAHDPVEGMIGMELLSLFDVDLDFPHNRIRLFDPRTADATGLVEIPAVVINESMLIGIRLLTPEQKNVQPILGILDCGSTFSCINWKAAQTLGLPPNKNDPLYRNGQSIAALGLDGRPLTLPTVKKQLSYAGDPIIDSDSGRPIGFESPPANWKPWDPVRVAVGDIPVFSNILGDGVAPYQGPAALIGLDVLAQRRVLLEAAGTNSNSRLRKVAIAPSS